MKLLSCPTCWSRANKTPISMFKRAVWRCSGCGAHFVKILGVYTTLGKEFSSPGPSKELAATYNQTLRLLIARHALHLDPVGKRPSPDAVFLAWYLWGDAHLQDRLTRSQTRSPRTTADWMGMPGKIYQVQSMLGAFQVLLLWPRSMWRAQLESFWRTTGRSEKGLREFWAAHDLDDLELENLSAFPVMILTPNRRLSQRWSSEDQQVLSEERWVLPNSATASVW